MLNYYFRIINNQHQWPDVLVGVTLGALIAISAFIMKEKQVLGLQYNANVFFTLVYKTSHLLYHWSKLYFM